MTKINSVAAFFRATEGKKVRRHVDGTLTLDTWGAWLESAKKQLIDQGAKEEDLVVDEVGLSVKGTGQHWRKPKERSVSEGTIEVRSKDYIFTEDGKEQGVFGEKKGLTVVDNVLHVPVMRGTKTYTIID